MSPAGARPYEIEFYTDASGQEPCLRWIKEGLSPTKRRALGQAMYDVLQVHGVQVVGERSWGRQLGEGLFEFRVDRTVKSNDRIAEKIALRIFCHPHGDRKVMLLHGYDKGKSPSSRRQQREIETARLRLASWRAVQAELRKTPRRSRDATSKSPGRRKR